MPLLGARAGSVDETEDPMDFLEPVTQVHDGPSCEFHSFGALTGNSSSCAPVPTSCGSLSTLKKTRANELLAFMRQRRDEDGTTTFEGMDWLRKVSVSGVVNTMDEGLALIRESVELLKKNKHVKIRWSPATRWRVEHWKITLL